MELSTDCSELIEEDKKEDLKNLECTLKKITKNPPNTGIPIGCYFSISLIQEQTNIPHNNILLCLKKTD